ncbi:hypothetical protein PRIPAC_78489 [Pristionchus pacificus]|uniref:Uncharacterized protein n=1 Tax=Pristionchus pacificus TaxID=54126 RepID=A0A454XMJ4_PRIPA|nr:hypothetical protein PRIPAC_78489 [Pristionchus pacificus]|eukprot:PDM70717.1 hypothetical protein PRIPAC_44921 [Pristionchus pacificus]
MQGPLDFKTTPIKDLVPNMGQVNCHFIVIDKHQGGGFRNATGEFIQLKVGDPTGAINMNLIVGECSDLVQPGDICKLRNGMTSFFRGSMSLQCGKQGELCKVGELTMIFSETPNMSDYNSDWARDFPPKTRVNPVPSNDLNSTPVIGAPPRNSGQPILNLLPPGPSSHGQPSSMPRDPRAAKRFHDPRSAAAAGARD